MKTLKLLIKTGFFDKINDVLASTFSNKCLIEVATKCLFRKSVKSTHSIGMCFTVSGTALTSTTFRYVIA